MEAFQEISVGVVLVLAGLQLVGAIIAGYRGIGAMLLFGLGVIAGVILAGVGEPISPDDNVERSIGGLMVVVGKGALLIVVGLGLALVVTFIRWFIRWVRKRRALQ